MKAVVYRFGWRGKAITMVGRHNGADRLAQIRAWVMERAGSLELPMSEPLLCETAVSRLGVSGAVLAVDTSQGWPETRHVTDPTKEGDMTAPCGDENGPVLGTSVERGGCDGA